MLTVHTRKLGYSLMQAHAAEAYADSRMLFTAALEQGLDPTGLTETANFGLPDGSLDTGSALDPFDWSAAPAVPRSDSCQDPHQDPWDCTAIPDELVTCQHDAPEPLKVTPSRSGYAKVCETPYAVDT